MKEFSSKLLDLLRESVLVTSLLALILVGTSCYLWATGREVPRDLFVILGTVIGFFFGAKTQAAQQMTATRIEAAAKAVRKDC